MVAEWVKKFKKLDGNSSKTKQICQKTIKDGKNSSKIDRRVVKWVKS
jgi:hypothetical protein